ncbi:hypothetical protein HanHA89_Chr15g0604031 [Helianthus annuus]|nr:hypothetical protein HanHA89_Chr15g0604031 [Helianthus annuus]
MGDTVNTQPPNSAAKPEPLHPVYTVTNIQNKVRILDGTKVTYSSWVKLFQLHARGDKVLTHIDGTDPPAEEDPTYASWLEVDSIVLQWIYGTLSDELLARVLEPDSTAYEAWNRIKKIFHNNKGSRTTTLEHQLSNITLRSMPSLDAYCQRIKELADQLKDVGSPVTDQRLVIQLVRGLPAEFDTTRAIINQTLPSWDDAVDMLQQEIQRQEAREALTPTEAHAAVSQHSTRHSQNSRNSGQQRNSGSGSTEVNRGLAQQPTRGTGKRRGGNSGQGHSSYSAQNRSFNTTQQQAQGQYRGPRQHQPHWAPPTPYWPPYWAGPFQPPPCPYPSQSGWASPWAPPPPGSSGPNFTKPHDVTQQAHITEVNPLDSTELEVAFSAMTMEPDTSQWTMDTGATSHLASESGPADWEAPELT